MAIKLYIADEKTKDAAQLLATFEMKGAKLSSKWEPKSEWYRDDIEGNGIVYKGAVLKPADGKPFYDALPIVFARSSTFIVSK